MGVFFLFEHFCSIALNLYTHTHTRSPPPPFLSYRGKMNTVDLCSLLHHLILSPSWNVFLKSNNLDSDAVGEPEPWLS